MLRTTLFATAAVLLLALAAVFTLRADESTTELQRRLGEQRYHDLGLMNLSPEQQDRLCRLLVPPVESGSLDRAAARYLEKEGWRPVRVIAMVTEEIGIGERDVLMVMDKYETVYLRLFGIAEMPYPGWYWAKNTLSSWELVYPDGETVSFTQERVD